MDAEPTSSLYSCADSGFYSQSECSTPPTPSFSRHLRNPSSTSSLSSSPPVHEPIEAPNASGKLPKLTEEPIERDEDDYDYVTVDAAHRSYAAGDDQACEPQQHVDRTLFGHAYDFTDVTGNYFTHDSEYLQNSPKRRRSAESSAAGIAGRMSRRFPSLSRRLRDGSRSSKFDRASRSATPSRVPSTRSSSITSSIQQGFDLTDRIPSSPVEQPSNERLNESFVSSPIDIAKANAMETDSEEVETEHFATTPLLPPLLVKTRLDDLPAESPLQSPTVADPTQSLVATPIGTPPVRATYPTPPLSSKPSVSSFHTTRPGHMVPSTDIPPIMLTNPNDKWAMKLGHANFTIQPEPYLPENCDATSLRQLFADWEQARCNYTKHQVRTGEHFGVTSKTYLLTEQKWAEIDAEWKKNNDLAVSLAAAAGDEPEPTSPAEPAPLCKMPTLNDARSEGKFPKLGDEDIVGPMVQIAAQIQRAPPGKKRAFFKFFSDMKFPGTSAFLGRSSIGVRSK